MHATYWKDDDILEVRLSDKSVAREVSENWQVHESYAEDGELVCVVLLDAVKEGYFTPAANGRRAASPQLSLRAQREQAGDDESLRRPQLEGGEAYARSAAALIRNFGYFSRLAPLPGSPACGGDRVSSGFL